MYRGYVHSTWYGGKLCTRYEVNGEKLCSTKGGTKIQYGCATCTSTSEFLFHRFRAQMPMKRTFDE